MIVLEFYLNIFSSNLIIKYKKFYEIVKKNRNFFNIFLLFFSIFA
jgi:hypothetical protein